MILLPKNIELEHIHAEGKKNIKNYFPQRMEAIIKLIQKKNFATLQKKKDRVVEIKPYVYSDDMNTISGNYKEYIDLLFHLGLLIIDEDYSNKEINPFCTPYPKSIEFSAIYREKLFYQDTKGIINRNFNKEDISNNIKYSILNTMNYESKELAPVNFNRLKRFYAFLNFDIYVLRVN